MPLTAVKIWSGSHLRRQLAAVAYRMPWSQTMGYVMENYWRSSER